MSDLSADPFPPASLAPDEVPEGMETILNPIEEGVQQFLEVEAEVVPEDAECWNCGCTYDDCDGDLAKEDGGDWECPECRCDHSEITSFFVEWSGGTYFDSLNGSYPDGCDVDDEEEVARKALRVLKAHYPLIWQSVDTYG